MIETQKGATQTLQEEFVRRCRNNPAYSLRAFAKFLDIDQSLLSKIMRGQRTTSAQLSKKISDKLGIMSPNSVFNPLKDDIFQLVSDWHHFAILEFAKTKTFSTDAKSIARRLGIRPEQVQAAVERLQRLGFIKIQGKKWHVLSPNNSWTNDEQTNAGRRQLQRHLMELSLRALDEVPFEKRDHGSITLAINKKRIPELKKRLSEIRRELGNEFQKTGEPLDEVFQITVSLFPLTRF